MDEFLKMSIEDFIAFAKQQSYTDIKRLKSLLDSNYDQCKRMKDSLSAILLQAEMPEEDKKTADYNIGQLYVFMQLIEDRHRILLEVEKDLIKKKRQ